MADGVFDHFYNEDKNETYEVVDAQARSDISVLESDVSALDSGKVDKVTGKGLSTNDYTTEEKIKLQGIEDNAEVDNVWFCVVDEAHVNANNSHIIDIYAHTVGRRLRRSTAPRFDAGDMLRVYFNGVDVDNILPVSQLVAYRLVINEAYESGVEPSEPYGMGYDRYFFSPYSQREFTFIQDGNYLNLSFVYTQASEDMHGEISVTSSLTSNATEVAASAYAVKRLKDLIDSISGGSLTYEVVQTLPVSDISTTTIYLVPKQTAGTQNVYDEYINPTGVPSGWEKLGDTEIDLTNYYTKTETDALLDDKADTADLATVATTGSYNDLVDKPSIPSGQVQSDWNQTNSSEVDYIKNKPTIPAAQVNADWDASSGVAQILNKPTIPDISTKMDKANPTGTGRLLIENDSTASYMRTSVSSTGGQAQIETDTSGNSGLVCRDSGGTYHTAVKLNASTGAWYGDLVTQISGKQATLVSGTNIKTINGRTILGSGDFSIPELDNYRTVTSGEASAASGSWTSAYAFTFGATGLWLVQISLTWSTNATGYREAGLNTSVAQPTAMNVMRMSPANGVQTTANLTLLVNVTSASQTYYIVQRHNAGTSLTVYPRMTVVRLSY